jgi:predicted alpha/beta hydrolase
MRVAAWIELGVACAAMACTAFCPPEYVMRFLATSMGSSLLGLLALELGRRP